jgi:hypothetical protein
VASGPTSELVVAQKKEVSVVREKRVPPNFLGTTEIPVVQYGQKQESDNIGWRIVVAVLTFSKANMCSLSLGECGGLSLIGAVLNQLLLLSIISNAEEGKEGSAGNSSRFSSQARDKI